MDAVAFFCLLLTALSYLSATMLDRTTIRVAVTVVLMACEVLYCTTWSLVLVPTEGKSIPVLRNARFWYLLGSLLTLCVLASSLGYGRSVSSTDPGLLSLLCTALFVESFMQVSPSCLSTTCDKSLPIVGPGSYRTGNISVPGCIWHSYHSTRGRYRYGRQWCGRWFTLATASTFDNTSLRCDGHHSGGCVCDDCASASSGAPAGK